RFRGNPIVLLGLLRDRLPQLANARSGRVLREAVIEGLLRRVDDVRRRREVGLSDREREDLLAAGLQVRDEVADADRRGWFNREDALRETGHGGREDGRIEKGSPHRSSNRDGQLFYSVGQKTGPSAPTAAPLILPRWAKAEFEVSRSEERRVGKECRSRGS